MGDLIRAALNALHEAFGTPTTRCAHVNRVLREYPDANPNAIGHLLRLHDQGECLCHEHKEKRDG